MFRDLKVLKENYIVFGICYVLKYCLKKIQFYESKFEEVFSKWLRIIVKYSVGVRCNVCLEKGNGKEYFIDVVIVELN